MERMKSAGLVDGDVRNKFVTMHVVDLIGLMACAIYDFEDGLVAHLCYNDPFRFSSVDHMELKLFRYSMEEMDNWEVKMAYGRRVHNLLHKDVNVVCRYLLK